jgi:hypothetical protein
MTRDDKRDLLLALLAMDSYNQGYEEGLTHGSKTIGSATLKDRPEGISISNWQSAGFYAAAYELPGETVISFRGTDDLDLPFSADDMPVEQNRRFVIDRQD